MPDNRRLEDLKRRVQQDPASIAFAALADEYRRLGLFHDAIETCRAGLLRHPAYLSARVTLGRALLEIGEYDEAQMQLEQVVRAAPDNLAAIRALADIHHRRGDAPDSYALDLHQPPGAQEGAPALKPVQDAPAASAAPLRVVPIAIRSGGSGSAGPLQFESHRVAGTPAPAPAAAEPAAASAVPPRPGPPPDSPPPPSATTLSLNPVCKQLEEFLAAIERAREEAGLRGAAGSR